MQSKGGADKPGFATHNAYIRDAVVFCGGLDALLGENADLPARGVEPEEIRKEGLDSCVGLLSHVALFGFAVDPVAVWALGGVEVLFEGNKYGRGRGHGYTSLIAILNQPHSVN